MGLVDDGTYGLTTSQTAQVDPAETTTPYLNYNFPQFPIDYLTGTTYGNPNSFATDLFNYYKTGTPLFIFVGNSSTLYQGSWLNDAVEGPYLYFLGIQGPNINDVATLFQSDISTLEMYSGSQLMTCPSTPSPPPPSCPDNANLGFYFGDAFTIGFLPSTIGTMMSNPINITDALVWQPMYIPLYYDIQYPPSITGGPWFDLYAKLLHEVAVSNVVSSDLNGVGLCYGYDFDDSLGISGTLSPKNPTPSSPAPYLGITLGAVDTGIPDPYSASTTSSYMITFDYPNDVNHSLQYQLGGGSWITLSPGGVIPSTNMMQLAIRYTNCQGLHQFNVYPLYQLLQPVNTYNDGDGSVINSTTITPNSTTPTSFVINLLP
jgi:hypothetical protein